MKNLYLDPATNDLALKNFNLRFTSTNTEWLSQRIENEFKFFAGEWFAEQTRGIDHYGKVLIKQVNLNEVTSLYLNHLKNIEGVEEVISFEADYIGNTRTYNVSFVVLSTEGEVVENNFIL